MAKLVSKTYGEALYELAEEKNNKAAMLEEVTALKETLAANPELNSMMVNPRLSKEERVGLLESVFSGRISEDLVSFLCLLEQKNRYKDAEAVLDYFIERVREDEGIGTAYITTAIPLTDAKKKEIHDKILNDTKYRKIDAVFTVDESIIGGMIIRIRDRVVDSSIRTKLDNMERELHKVMLETE